MKKKWLIALVLILALQTKGTAEEIEFRTFKKTDTQETATIIAQAFIQKPGCPMTRFQRVTEEEFIQFSGQICEVASIYELSFVAVDGDKIVGALITLPGHVDIEPNVYNRDKFSPILHLLGDLDEGFFLDRGAHHLFLAVHPDFQQKQIGRKLLEKSDQELKSKGFPFSFAEAATPMSQKLFRKLGYITEKEIFYETYGENGQFFFGGIETFYEANQLSCKLVFHPFIEE